jgi:hypothetical protein
MSNMHATRAIRSTVNIFNNNTISNSSNRLAQKGTKQRNKLYDDVKAQHDRISNRMKDITEGN